MSMLWGGGLTKKFPEPCSGKEIFWSSRRGGGVRAMLPWKIFKIKGPRLAKNDFSLEKLDKKISQHVALLLNLGVLKNVCWLRGGGGASAPLAPPSGYGPEQHDQL